MQVAGLFKAFPGSEKSLFATSQSIPIPLRQESVRYVMVLGTVRSLVRNSWTGYTVSRAGKWYLRSLRGWPEDVLDLLILACKIPHLTQRLGDLLTYLRSINPNPYVEFWSGKPPLLI